MLGLSMSPLTGQPTKMSLILCRVFQYASLLKEQVLFDGRNCYDLEEMKGAGVDYYSIGRPVVKVERELV